MYGVALHLNERCLNEAKLSSWRLISPSITSNPYKSINSQTLTTSSPRGMRPLGNSNQFDANLLVAKYALRMLYLWYVRYVPTCTLTYNLQSKANPTSNRARGTDGEEPQDEHHNDVREDARKSFFYVDIQHYIVTHRNCIIMLHTLHCNVLCHCNFSF